MSKLPPDLNHMFQQVAGLPATRSVFHFFIAIVRLGEARLSEAQKFEWDAERIGLSVTENPFDGRPEWPDAVPKSTELLDYWEDRSKEETNELLRHRYACLVWEYSRTIRGRSAGVGCAQLVIESSIRIAEGRYFDYDFEVMPKLRHALRVALEIADTTRALEVLEVTMRLERAGDGPHFFGTWSLAFELLTMMRVNEASLATQSEEVIRGLTHYLKRVASGASGGDPDYAQRSFESLASHHYRKREKANEALFETLDLYWEIVEKYSEGSSSLIAVDRIETAIRSFESFQALGLTEKARIALRKAQKRLGRDMRENVLRVSIVIDEKLQEAEITDLITGPIRESLKRVAVRFTPSPVGALSPYTDLVDQNPLIAFFKPRLVDEDGRSIGELGEISGYQARRISEQILYDSGSLRETINRLQRDGGLTATILGEILMESLCFEEERRALLDVGLSAFFEGNHVVAVHVLIPQLEHAVQKLTEEIQGPVLGPIKSGSQTPYVLLDALLRHPNMKEVLLANAQLYLRVLLTDQKGQNFRNKVCHGWLKPSEFNTFMSDRVLHALLVLAFSGRRLDDQKSDGT